GGRATGAQRGDHERRRGARDPARGGATRRRVSPVAGTGEMALEVALLPIELEEYLTWLAVERGRSRNTLDAYRRDLVAYATWRRGRGRSLTEAEETDVVEYVGALRASGRAPASVARSTAAVRNLYRFLVEEGRMAIDPAVAVAAPPVPLGLPKALTEE